MFRPRIIPVLLLKNGALVKSVSFKNHRYIGDPLNAIRIFNEHGADELVLLDIDATKNKTCINPELVRALGEEADMPLSVGGGISTIGQIKNLVAAGAEKVIIGTSACINDRFVQAAADVFGSSTITVCMDVGQNWLGQERVYHTNGKVATAYTPEMFAEKMERFGAGELIVQSISRDGTMSGYDIRMLRRMAGLTTLPIVALGGAGSLQHLAEGFHKGMATGLAAGSLFVYNNTQRGVLINYPDSKAFLDHA